MKKLLTILSLSALLMTTAAYAAPEAQKIAVVDIQKVVAASSQVKALKASQDAKNKELTASLKMHRQTVNKQTDAKKKKSLAEHMKNSLNKKEKLM